MARAKTTTDHEVIRQWVEQRGGCPAEVESTAKRSTGLLRIDYPGYSGKTTLKQIPWDDFFAKFDDSKLAFLYQEEPDSRFSKLIKQRGATGKRTRRSKSTSARGRKTSAEKKAPQRRTAKAKSGAAKKKTRRRSA